MKKIFVLLFLFGAFALLLTVPTSYAWDWDYDVNGNQINGKFWSYYKAGAKFQEAGNLKKALYCFEKVVELDPEKGRARRARTYGMHFLEGYNPLERIEKIKKLKAL